MTSISGVRTAKDTWVRAHGWCNDFGIVGDEQVGIALVPDPPNRPPSWSHDRNNELLTANAFDLPGLKQCDERHVEITRGQNLSLRCGLPSHAAPS